MVVVVVVIVGVGVVVVVVAVGGDGAWAAGRLVVVEAVSDLKSWLLRARYTQKSAHIYLRLGLLSDRAQRVDIGSRRRGIAPHACGEKLAHPVSFVEDRGLVAPKGVRHVCGCTGRKRNKVIGLNETMCFDKIIFSRKTFIVTSRSAAEPTSSWP